MRQVNKFDGKKGFYLKSVCVFFLLKIRKLIKKLKIFRPIRELEIEKCRSGIKLCSLEPAWSTEFKTGLSTKINPQAHEKVCLLNFLTAGNQNVLWSSR